MSVPITELTELIPNPEAPVEKKAKAPVEKKAPAKKEKKAKTEPVETPAEPIEESAPAENSTEPTEEIMNAPIEEPTETDVENSAPTEPAEPDAEKVLTLAQKLKALRQEKKLTNAMIAKEVGISVETYKSLEYRNGHPRDKKIYDKLAKVLGCDVSYLTEGDKRYKGKDKKPTKKDDVIPAKKPAPAEENISEEPVPTLNAMDKAEPVPTETAMNEPPIQDPREIEENIPIDSVEEPVVPAEKSSASSEVIKLVSRLSVLLAGDEISKSEKDAVMLSLNEAYWR